MHHFFSWFYSNVWGNIVASLIWGTPTFFVAFHHFRKNHNLIKEIHTKLHQKESNKV